MKLCLVLAILFASVSAGPVDFNRQDDEKPSISDAMTAFHKGDKLHQVVGKGEASDAQKKQLLDLYIHMSEQKPPKGDAEEWQKQLQPIIAAAAKVVVGREGAEKEYMGATNCMACHKKFKP